MQSQIEIEEVIRENNFQQERLINERSAGERIGQRERLRRMFLSRPNEWIILPTVMNVGGSQYGSRILELRREGMVIENKILEVVNGSKHTAFKYIPKEGR